MWKPCLGEEHNSTFVIFWVSYIIISHKTLPMPIQIEMHIWAFQLPKIVSEKIERLRNTTYKKKRLYQEHSSAPTSGSVCVSKEKPNKKVKMMMVMVMKRMVVKMKIMVAALMMMTMLTFPHRYNQYLHETSQPCQTSDLITHSPSSVHCPGALTVEEQFTLPVSHCSFLCGNCSDPNLLLCCRNRSSSTFHSGGGRSVWRHGVQKLLSEEAEQKVGREGDVSVCARTHTLAEMLILICPEEQH